MWWWRHSTKVSSCKWWYYTRKVEHQTSTDHIVLEDETVRGDVYTGDKIVQEEWNRLVKILQILEL